MISGNVAQILSPLTLLEYHEMNISGNVNTMIDDR
jgi:hypothetical protein